MVKDENADQILVELNQPGSKTLHSKIHIFISSTWKKEEFP